MPPSKVLFCASHTVRGTCTFGYINDSGSNAQLTVPEGMYWTDPLAGYVQASDTVDLLGKIAALISTAISPDSIEAQYSFNDGYCEALWSYASGTGDTGFSPEDANTEGLRIYKRLGVSANRSTTGLSGTYDGGIVHGVWGPTTRPERTMASWAAGKVESMSVVNRSFDGVAWPHSVGQPLRSRLMQFDLVPAAYVRNETGLRNIGESGTDNDTTFETLMWRYLASGEYVRVYSDREATVTYLSSAMSVTDGTASVASGTGLSNGETIWIDGEQCYIVSGGGTTTLTLDRPNAVAHPKYAPISDAHVATYCLDSDGGNAGIGLLDVARRAYNNPRYDLEIPLIETRWE